MRPGPGLVVMALAFISGARRGSTSSISSKTTPTTSSLPPTLPLPRSTADTTPPLPTTFPPASVLTPTSAATSSSSFIIAAATPSPTTTTTSSTISPTLSTFRIYGPSLEEESLRQDPHNHKELAPFNFFSAFYNNDFLQRPASHLYSANSVYNPANNFAYTFPLPSHLSQYYDDPVKRSVRSSTVLPTVRQSRSRVISSKFRRRRKRRARSANVDYKGGIKSEAGDNFDESSDDNTSQSIAVESSKSRSQSHGRDSVVSDQATVRGLPVHFPSLNADSSRSFDEGDIFALVAEDDLLSEESFDRLIKLTDDKIGDTNEEDYSSGTETVVSSSSSSSSSASISASSSSSSSSTSGSGGGASELQDTNQQNALEDFERLRQNEVPVSQKSENDPKSKGSTSIQEQQPEQEPDSISEISEQEHDHELKPTQNYAHESSEPNDDQIETLYNAHLVSNNNDKIVSVTDEDDNVNANLEHITPAQQEETKETKTDIEDTKEHRSILESDFPLTRLNPWISACDLAQPGPLSAPDLQGECSAGTLPVAWVDEGPGPPKCLKSCNEEEETPFTNKLNKDNMSNNTNTNNTNSNNNISNNNNKHKNKKDNKINIKLVGYTTTTNTFNIKLRNSQPTISHSSINGDGGDVRDVISTTKDSNKHSNRKSKQQQQQQQQHSQKLLNPFNYYQIHKNYNNNYSKMTKTRRNSNERRPQIIKTTTTMAAETASASKSKATSSSSSSSSPLPADSSTTVELATGKTKTSANMTNANENTTNILDATITHTNTNNYSDDIYDFMHEMQQDAAAHSDTDGVDDIVDEDVGNDEDDDDDDREDADDDNDHNVHNDAAVADNSAFAMQLQQFQQQQQQQQQQQYHHNQQTQQNQANNNIVKMKLTTTAGASSRSASQQFQLKYNRLQSNHNENNSNNAAHGGGGGGNTNNNNKRHHQSYQLQVQDVPDFNNKMNNNYGSGQQQRLANVNSNSYGSSSNSDSNSASSSSSNDVFPPAAEQNHQQQPQQQCLEYLGDSANTTPEHLCNLTSPSQLLAQLRHLRLRNCCERNVYSALHTLALNATLSGGESCIRILEDLIELDALASRITCGLSEILFRFDCRQVYSIIHQCEDCKEAYRRWVCSTLVPYFAEPSDVIKPSEIYETTTDSGQYPHRLYEQGQQSTRHYQTVDEINQRSTVALNTKSSSDTNNNNNKSPTSYTTSSSSSNNNNHSNNTNMASNMTTSHKTITAAATTTTNNGGGSGGDSGSNNTRMSSTKLTKRAATATTSNFITATTVNSNNNNYDDIEAHLQRQHKEQQLQHASSNNNKNNYHYVKRRSTHQHQQQQQPHINNKQFNDKLKSNYIPYDNALHKRPQQTMTAATNNTPRPPASSQSASESESAATTGAAVAAITTSPPTLTRKTQALTFNDVIFINKTTSRTMTTTMRTTTTTGYSSTNNSPSSRSTNGGGNASDDNTASGLNSSGQYYNNKSTNKRRKRNDGTTTSVYIGDNKPNLAEQDSNGEDDDDGDDDNDNEEQNDDNERTIMLKHHQIEQPNNSKIVVKQPQQQQHLNQEQQSIHFITTANSEDSSFVKDPVISKLLKRTKRKVEFRKRRRIRPCLSVCQTVEQKCPYLLPADRAPAMPTQYAGEPTFLCLDYNIAETEEQLRKASHGPNECCYTYCQTASDGICTYCNEFLDAKDIEMEAERINKENVQRIYNITLKPANEKSLRVETKIQQQLAPIGKKVVDDGPVGGQLKMSTVAISVRNDTWTMNVTRLAERLPYYAYCDGVYYYDEDIDDMPTMAYSDNCPALPTVQSRCHIPYWATNYETSGEVWGSYRKHSEAQKLMVWLSSLLCLWSCYTARALRLNRRQEKRPKQPQQQQQQKHQQQQINNNNTAFERKFKENLCRNCENREIMLMNVNNLTNNNSGRRRKRAGVNVWYDISENRILIICIMTGAAGVDDDSGSGEDGGMRNNQRKPAEDRREEEFRFKGEKEMLINFREFVRRRQQIDLLYSKNALILLVHYTNRLKSFMQQAQPHRKRKLTHLNGWWYRWGLGATRHQSSKTRIPQMVKIKMKFMYKKIIKSIRKRRMTPAAQKHAKSDKNERRVKKYMNCSNVSFSNCSCSLISCSCNNINKNYNTIFNNITNTNNNNNKYNYKIKTNIKRKNNKKHVKINYKENMKKLKFNFSTCNFKDTNNNNKINNNNNYIKIYKRNYDYYNNNKNVNHNKSNDINVIFKLSQQQQEGKIPKNEQQQQFSIITTKLQCNTKTRSHHYQNTISLKKIARMACIQAPKHSFVLSTSPSSSTSLLLVSSIFSRHRSNNNKIVKIHYCRHKILLKIFNKNIFKTTTTTTKKHQNHKYAIMSRRYISSLPLSHHPHHHHCCYYPDDNNSQKISYNSKLNNYSYFYDYNFNINDWWHRYCYNCCYCCCRYSTCSSIALTSSSSSRCSCGPWYWRQKQRLHDAIISASKNSSNCQITTNTSNNNNNNIVQYHHAIIL
ncbi:calcium-permeable channel component Mid1 [Musca autumnalis]|uniref:calcium-permeable channel component Mid1 n=1 Tax=Musca autumnalis TaxID=221902 RepID=UPI003CFA20EF